jgi:xylulokinase
MPLVAGVDSSTQSCTVSLLDTDTGVVVAEGRARHQRAVPPVSEQNPADWWSALRAALAEADAAAGVGAAVQAAAVLSGRSPADVLAQWQPLPTREIEPRPRVCAAAVRSRYVELSTWPGHHRPLKEKA